MIIELDFESELPIYLQVKNEIIEGIARGNLKPGESLPAIRSLAADIGVNMHTIRKSYQLLKQKGFVSISRKNGVVIHSDLPQVNVDYTAELKEDIKPLLAEAVCRGMDQETWNQLCNEILSDLRRR